GRPSQRDVRSPELLLSQAQRYSLILLEDVSMPRVPSIDRTGVAVIPGGCDPTGSDSRRETAGRPHHQVPTARRRAARATPYGINPHFSSKPPKARRSSWELVGRGERLANRIDPALPSDGEGNSWLAPATPSGDGIAVALGIRPRSGSRSRPALRS